MRGFSESIKYYLVLAVFCVSLFAIHALLPRSQFPYVLAWYSVAFVAYAVLCALRNKVRTSIIISSIIITRLFLLWGVPSLSDDIFRFLWDGKLIHLGISPFAFKPSEMTLSNSFLIELFPKLNSPTYYSVYTPLNLLIGYGSTFGSSLIHSVFIYRCILLSIEMTGLYYCVLLLKQKGQSMGQLVLFYLNPLIVLEFTGNLHLEGAVSSFLIVAFYYMSQQKSGKAAIALALATALKILPLIYFGFFLIRRKWKTIFIGGIFVFLLLLLPFGLFYDHEFIAHYTESLRLYFGQFEFNSSVYRLLQALDYNASSWLFWLKLCFLLGVLVIAFLKKLGFYEFCLFIMTGFLFFSQSIHPWYVGGICVFSLFTSWRYPIVWSYLVFWTYITYQNEPLYEQSTLVIVVEYVALILFMGVEALGWRPFNLSPKN